MLRTRLRLPFPPFSSNRKGFLSLMVVLVSAITGYYLIQGETRGTTGSIDATGLKPTLATTPTAPTVVIVPDNPAIQVPTVGATDVAALGGRMTGLIDDMVTVADNCGQAPQSGIEGCRASLTKLKGDGKSALEVLQATAVPPEVTASRGDLEAGTSAVIQACDDALKSLDGDQAAADRLLTEIQTAEDRFVSAYRDLPPGY